MLSTEIKQLATDVNVWVYSKPVNFASDLSYIHTHILSRCYHYVPDKCIRSFGDLSAMLKSVIGILLVLLKLITRMRCTPRWHVFCDASSSRHTQHLQCTVHCFTHNECHVLLTLLTLLGVNCMFYMDKKAELCYNLPPSLAIGANYVVGTTNNGS